MLKENESPYVNFKYVSMKEKLEIFSHSAWDFLVRNSKESAISPTVKLSAILFSEGFNSVQIETNMRKLFEVLIDLKIV